MGEAKRRQALVEKALSQAVGVETHGGRIQVRWDSEAATTPLGQMVFFVEFLALTGLFERWVASCPLDYQGPHRSSTRDILGTWMLSMLSGHRRYAHITTLRADGVTPSLLGMTRTVSEDTVRRALSALDAGDGVTWLQTHLDDSVRPLLQAPWILDVDVTIKPLYGQQEGAVVGYNPKKPGRPAHTYHTYQMAGLRLILGVDVDAGNQGHANHSLPGLLRCVDQLTPEQRPKLIRGDAGFGTDAVMRGLEARQIPYLFKLRQTQNVKRHIEKSFGAIDWHDAGQGWEGRDSELKLQGWERARRVIVLRRPLIGEVVLSDDRYHQFELAFVECAGSLKRYEYAVLVTDLTHEVLTLTQLYRDRADSENTFDELKNQWGWGGFATHDLARCQLSAMGVALVYNWWSLFVRLANPSARMEAITSRPLLLTGVGRQTRHAGQQQLTITPIHGKSAKAMDWLTQVSQRLNAWKRIAEQLPLTTVWQQVCEYIITCITGFNWLDKSTSTPQKAILTG
jgi:hypothetical protein